MIDVELTGEQEQLLRDQVIDARQPGPVLHDFEMVLDFLGEPGVVAAGKYHLLPLSAIAELDERLERPLRLNLQRPQIRSHPYLQGLNLLLRASGLAVVEGGRSKARLRRNPDTYQAWQGLNPTERYFNLLEAALLNGRPEMVGERGGGSGDDFLTKCATAWQQPPRKGAKFDTSRPYEVHVWGLYRHFYLLALMDLFG